MKNQSRLLRSFSVCVFLLAAALPAWAQSPVSIHEEPLVLPTYEIGPPDLEPMFYTGRNYQGARGAIYPYGLYDNLLDVRDNKTYKADFLENRYVKICVLPELGGRILACSLGEANMRAIVVTNLGTGDLALSDHAVPKPGLVSCWCACMPQV